MNGLGQEFENLHENFFEWVLNNIENFKNIVEIKVCISYINYIPNYLAWNDM